MKKNLNFNSVPLDKIKIETTLSYSQTIADSDIKAFAELSGDRNPVHLDEDYAIKSQFKKRIAHGMMTASFFSALFGTKILGEGCVYTHQSLNFRRPVYINDTVEAIVTVIKVDLEKRRVKFKTICKVDDKIVTEGKAEIYVPIQFRKLMINEKKELLEYKSQILNLFTSAFETKMERALCF